MLPVCSTTPAAYAQCQALHYVGSKTLFPFRKGIEECGTGIGDRFMGSNWLHGSQVSCKTNATKFSAGISPNIEQSDPIGFGNHLPFRNDFDAIARSMSDECIYPENQEGRFPVQLVNNLPPSRERLCFVESSAFVNKDSLLKSDFSNVSPVELSSQNDVGGQLEGLSNLPSAIEPTTDLVVTEQSVPEALKSSDASTFLMSNDPSLSSNPYGDASNSFSQVKENLLRLLSKYESSFDELVNSTSDNIRESLDAFNMSVTNAKKSIIDPFENSISGLLPPAGKTGESVDTKLIDIQKELNENASKVGLIALDALRNGLVTAENYLGRGSSFIVDYYQSTKLLLPPEIQVAVNSSEENVGKILEPVKVAFDQVSVTFEELEKFLGFDPNDPVVPIIFFVGSSLILVISYRVIRYGGYAGDLSPALTMELLSTDDTAILVDIRPESSKDKDGIPDIGREARFRYTSVSVPEVNGSVKKLLKSTKDVDDALLADVIKNLKVVQDRSKVIILDTNGSRSKSVARSLSNLGLKQTYLVAGGFNSWVKEGLRVKENKDGFALTILTEDAQAILEQINPTPLKSLAFGLILLASAYALYEWEKTLQIIGILGLGQSFFGRVSNYENAEELKEDLRTLITPIILGSQAISWVAEKLESNNIGLPTSPSSTAVQSRVQQAAAKHESQPSDEEKSQDSASAPAAASET